VKNKWRFQIIKNYIISIGIYIDNEFDNSINYLLFLWDAADFIGMPPFDLEDMIRSNNDEVVYARAIETY
jgi:hypothetical protein